MGCFGAAARHLQAEVAAEDLIYEIGLDRVTVIEVAAAEVVVEVVASSEEDSTYVEGSLWGAFAY